MQMALDFRPYLHIRLLVRPKGWPFCVAPCAFERVCAESVGLWAVVSLFVAGGADRARGARPGGKLEADSTWGTRGGRGREREREREKERERERGRQRDRKRKRERERASLLCFR